VNGSEHYQYAETLLALASDDELGSDTQRFRLAKAQVHATLALAAATALVPSDYGVAQVYEQWRQVAQ